MSENQLPGPSDDQWREKLSPQEFQVLREGGTERAYTGEYWDNKAAGMYSCRACGAALFTSTEKFDSRCGWPSFFEPAADANIRYLRDVSMGMERVEVRCGSCDSHLGHLFTGEGFDTPTDQRYCINSISMDFHPSEEG